MGRRRGFFENLAHEAEQAERAQRRRQRELQAQVRAADRAERAAAKEALRLEAQQEAALYSNQIDLLLSVHHETSPAIDWQGLKAVPRPTFLAADRSRSQNARLALEAYRPGFFERLFGLTGRLQRLEAHLAEMLAAEEDDQKRIAREASAATAQWTEQVALASAVLSGDLKSYLRVSDESGCLAELEELGCMPTVEFLSADLAHVLLAAPGPDVVPSEEKNLTAGGKLSTKNMAVGKRWEIYQDFLCGVALRAARELLSVLPLDGALVDVSTKLLNSANGHLETSVVLSVFCTRDAMRQINFPRADPSQVVESLMHSMKFTRSKGISPTPPISPHELISVSPARRTAPRQP